MTTRGPYRATPRAGTVRALADAYRASPRWAAWSAHTRGHADRVLAKLVDKHGDAQAKSLTRGVLQQAVDRIATRDGYGAAKHWLTVVSGMLAYGARLDWLPSNPARDVERPGPPHQEGLRTWREDEIAAFLDRWPLGTLPHLAMALMLYTGAARLDACGLGWQNVRGDAIEYRRAKTARAGGPLIRVRIAPPLAAALALVPRDRMTFLETTRGRARSANGLTESFREWVEAAGLEARDALGRRLTAHGLRKAMGRRLADAGCTPHQIQAVLGHASLREAERYTRAYDRAAAADEAMERLANISPAATSNIQRLKR